MSIKGIWAEYAHTLNPEQWVKVWLVNIWFPDDYYGLCQVKDLMSVIDTDYAPFDEYALQPCDPDGNLIEFEGVGELQS